MDAVVCSLLVSAGAAVGIAKADVIELAGFEGGTVGNVQPGYPDQACWVKPSDPDRNQYAQWHIEEGAGIGGSAAAVALPGTNAIGGSANYVQDLRIYYIPVLPAKEYTLGFWYKAIGSGFTGHTGRQSPTYTGDSEMQLLVLENPNSDCSGSWTWHGFSIGSQTGNWTYASYTFTTAATTHGLGMKFGMLFGDGNRTNATDRFYLDNRDPNEVAAKDVPKWWLMQHGLTNFNVDVMADSDGDGMRTWQEYIAGTDPTNRASVLQFTTIGAANGPQVVVRWSSESNRFYSLSRTTNQLGSAAAFLSVPGALDLPATPPMNVYTDSVPGVVPCLYRIQVRK